MSKKILICDDEEGIRESLKLILENDYEFIEAYNSEECLKTLEKNKDSIGLVLLDIKMPKVSGLDTLDEIKKKHPNMNTVIITGYRSVETAAEAAERGAQGYIVKPFKTDEIQETVAKNFQN